MRNVNMPSLLYPRAPAVTHAFRIDSPPWGAATHWRSKLALQRVQAALPRGTLREIAFEDAMDMAALDFG
jgi:hypothetical protein